MKSRSDIIELIEQNRSAIKNFGVRELGLFGSFAREEQQLSSDVDILVELERETFKDYMGLLSFLQTTFDRKVDLVMKDTIKPLIRDRILKETIYVPGF